MVQVCINRSKDNSPTGIRRSAMRRRIERLTGRLGKMTVRMQDLQQQVKQLRQQRDDSNRQLELAQGQLLQQAVMKKPMIDPLICRERPLPGHRFGPTLIATAITLAKRIGFRATADVLGIMFEALGIELKVPSHDAIEQWTLRLGVSAVRNTFAKDQRVLWMSDHSSQIGKEKVLQIIGIALDDLPAPGQTLELESMKVLAVVPGQSWQKKDVEREYLKLAKQIGAPVYLLCDGASELRDPADILQKDGRKAIVLGDLKHYAANVLEKEIGRNERFKAFLSEVGLTRNRVQQTELSQFCPPALKQKSRFMNVGSLLNWASMVLHHLNRPDSQARLQVSDERMQDKLGWLVKFAEDINQWRACEEVIDLSLTVINRRGLTSKTAKLVDWILRKQDVDWQERETPASRIGRRLIEYIEQSADKLLDGERGWLSTEILESLFGKFKQLGRQHSRGGFTRLIAALPTLCMQVTGEVVREGFTRVDSRDLSAWLRDKLPKTLTARRNAAYHEYRSQTCNQTLSAA